MTRTASDRCLGYAVYQSVCRRRRWWKCSCQACLHASLQSGSGQFGLDDLFARFLTCFLFAWVCGKPPSQL